MAHASMPDQRQTVIYPLNRQYYTKDHAKLKITCFIIVNSLSNLVMKASLKDKTKTLESLK